MKCMSFKVFQLFQILLFLSQVYCIEKIECSGETSEESNNNYKCKNTCYRPYDGFCNNLENPRWGTPNAIYERLFNTTSYKDGVHEIPDLINARKLSLSFAVDVRVEDNLWTVNTIWFGQAVAHDVSLNGGVPQTGPGVACPCVNGKLNYSRSESERCDPILLPIDDPYNTPEGRVCIDFLRTNSTYYSNRLCKGPAQQYNSVTSYLDGSIIYGNNASVAKSLRTTSNGMLAYQIRNGRMYPPQIKDKTFLCPSIGEKETLCFLTGDDRVNQNPQIALAQTIFLRYHNYIAKQLCTKINPQWSDERCFQVTRQIVIATIQHITYYEFLVFILGPEAMYKNNLIYKNVKGYVNDYDKNVNAGAINEHATAAYRLFHSAIVGFIKLFSQKRQEMGELRFSENLSNPSILLKKELEIATGASTQLQNEVDRFYDNEITQHLFQLIDEKLGDDLMSIDLYRSRDHGLASYADAMEQLGLGKPESFDDFKKYIPKKYVDLLRTLYKNPADVELRVGGNLETLVKGALSGITFNRIMTEQFRRLKFGDRYWYENGEQPCPFTTAQLDSIRKIKLSSVMCNHVSGFEKIQPRAFEKVSESNQIGLCKYLPRINLWLWKE